MQIEPIGIFSSQTTTKSALPRQGSLNKNHQGEIKIFSPFVEGLKDLQGIQRIWIIFGFHCNQKWKPLVLPPTSEKKRGVFATRSPYRPNFLGLTCCKIIRIDKNSIAIQNADLLDKTPIYDIKPYIPYADAFPKSRTGWIAKEEKKKFHVTWTPSLQKIKKRFEEKNLWDALNAVEQQLSFHPTDSRRKRVKKTKERGFYIYSYRYLRWKFKIHRAEKKITLIDVRYEVRAEEIDPHSITPEDRSAWEIIQRKN